jgi:hypothetical protein
MVDDADDVGEASDYRIERLSDGQLEVQHKSIRWDSVMRVKNIQRANDVIDDLRHGRPVRSE